MVIYDSASIYIEDADTIEAKIIRLDAIITALEGAALTSAAGQDVTEYSVDDGQTKIKTVIRGTDAIFKSIQAFEKLKQMYINRLNGRMFTLVDGKSFRH